LSVQNNAHRMLQCSGYWYIGSPALISVRKLVTLVTMQCFNQISSTQCRFLGAFRKVTYVPIKFSAFSPLRMN